MKTTVSISDFVLRQTPESEFTHFKGTPDELLQLVHLAISQDQYKDGYRDGVLVVRVAPGKFLTGLIELIEGDILVGEFKARREGEDPRQVIRVSRGWKEKRQAKSVEVILYRHDVLMEDDDASSDAEWEVIAINGYPTDEPGPIHFMTLMHNHCGSTGGTATNLEPEKLVEMLTESFEYYKDKGMLRLD